MAWGTLTVTCIHGAVYVTQWALAWAEGAGSYREVAWKLTDRNVTGLLALAAALAIGATSFAWVRTHHYRVSRGNGGASGEKVEPVGKGRGKPKAKVEPGGKGGDCGEKMERGGRRGEPFV